MNYNDYRTHLLTCEYLGKEPTGQYKKVRDFLTDLWDGVEIVVDSLNNMVVIQKVDGWVLEQDLKNGGMWCQYDRVWSFFSIDMGMEVNDTQDFIKSVVEEHLKCKVGTPRRYVNERHRVVEEQLKCKVGTP